MFFRIRYVIHGIARRSFVTSSIFPVPIRIFQLLLSRSQEAPRGLFLFRISNHLRGTALKFGFKPTKHFSAQIPIQNVFELQKQVWLYFSKPVSSFYDASSIIRLHGSSSRNELKVEIVMHIMVQNN